MVFVHFVVFDAFVAFVVFVVFVVFIVFVAFVAFVVSSAEVAFAGAVRRPLVEMWPERRRESAIFALQSGELSSTRVEIILVPLCASKKADNNE